METNMKLRTHYLALVVAAGLGLQGCGDLLDENTDTDTLIPEQSEPKVDRPSPPSDAYVIKTSATEIFDASGTAILLRGINLQYGDSPSTRINSIEPLAQTGSNVVRLQLRENTTAAELRAALDKIVDAGLIAMPMLWEEEGKITCTETDTYLMQYLDELWLGEWLEVLVDAKYQPHLMINIANEWGPMNVWNAASYGYSGYIDTYKSIIREFREVGFKVPLVIDAPHCGQDFNAFLGGRGQELLVADVESNLVLSVHAYGSGWNSSSKIITAADGLAKTGVPFIVGEFGGSFAFGDASIDHMDVMKKSVGDNALVFDFPWTGDTDKVAYLHTFAEPLNLTGSSVTANVYIPEKYINDGKLTAQMYLKDAGGRFASFGTELANDKDLRANAWTRLNYRIDSASDMEGFVTDGFELDNVASLGIEFFANGKPASINAQIKLDNVMIETGGATPPMYLADFNSDANGWATSWGNTNTTQASGALNLDHDWLNNGDFAIAIGGGNVNLDVSQPLTLTAKVFIPQSYETETGFGLKFFLQYGDSWGGWTDTGGTSFDNLTFGDWNEITFANVDLSAVDVLQRFGVQFYGATSAQTDPLLVDEVVVTGADGGGSAAMVALVGSDFSAGNDGWGTEYGISDVTASVANETLALTINWPDTAEKATYISPVAEGVVNAVGKTVKASFKMPDDYIDNGNMGIQIYLRDVNGVPAYINWEGVWAFTRGDFTHISYAITDDYNYGWADDGFDPTQINRIGVEFNPNGKPAEINGAIEIGQLLIEGEGSGELETIFEMNFDQAADADAWVFDYADGGFNQTVLDTAKNYGFGVVPFGWLAWSWYGNGEETKALDMSNTEDAYDLNERGTEIVDSENGIKATAVSAGFAP